MKTQTTNSKSLRKALSFVLLLSLVLATFASCSSVLVGKYVEVYYTMDGECLYDESEYYEFKANGKVTYVDGDEVITATYTIVDGDKIAFDTGNPFYDFSASFEKTGNRIIIDGDEYEKVK